MLITTGKQVKVLKVRQICLYALTVRLYLWVSDLVRSTAASKMQGRMTEKEREYSAYPRMILKFIRSHRSRIQTYDISLFTGAPSVPKKAIFKTWNSK